jgi:hypothetical protein
VQPNCQTRHGTVTNNAARIMLKKIMTKIMPLNEKSCRSNHAEPKNKENHASH